MRCRQGWVRVTTLFVVTVCVLVGQVSTAAATSSVCRTDPKLYFGNGDKLVIVTGVDAPRRAITKIHYVVHAPIDQADDQDTVHVVYTGLPGVEETTDIVFDLDTKSPEASAYAYKTEVTVYVNDNPTTVTVEMSLGKQVQTAYGVTGNPVTLGVER